MDAKSAIQIGLAISVLGALFLTYLSAKTWHWVQAVLVVCIFIASIFFWYMGAVVLDYHATHRSKIQELKPQLAQFRTDNETARNEIRQTAHDLRKILLGRGRVWDEAQPQNIGADGVAQLAIEDPQPHGIPSGVILFAFEKGPLGEGASYLGEFKVTESGEEAVTLTPTQKLAAGQLERLTQSEGAWTLYEVMPTDRRDVFVSMSDDELAELIPAESLEEYQKDQKPAAADDPEERVIGYTKEGVRATDAEADQVVERRYARRLRDYAQLFRRLHNQAVLDAASQEQLTQDAELLQDAIAKAEQDVAYRETEKTKLEYDKEKFEQELKVIESHLATVDRYLAAMRARVQEVFAKNRTAAAELAEVQLEAAAEINQRTAPVPAEGATRLQTGVQ